MQALIVPGSGLVKEQAESEGLDRVLIEAGMEWREPGCSMCLAMNADKLERGERCASTSNRNFEGRQGPGGRTQDAVQPLALRLFLDQAGTGDDQRLHAGGDLAALDHLDLIDG